MSAEDFEEDWQRPPGDINFLQDLLASIEGAQAHTQPGSLSSASGAAAAQGGFAPSFTGHGDTSSSEDAMVLALRSRERQVAVIERRRHRARRKCDAVDAAFERALEQRMKAMQHLALDPPAERLVGQGMTQYVPAALLPDDLLADDGQGRSGPLPLLPHSVVETHVHAQLTREQGTAALSHSPTVPAITGGPGGRQSEQDALVFLTQIDAGGDPSSATAVAAPTHHRSSRTGRSPRQHSQRTASSSSSRPLEPRETQRMPDWAALGEAEDDDEDGEREAWMRPSTVTEGNRDRWRELGYHVVVIGDASRTPGGERAAARRAFEASAAPAEGVGGEAHAAEPNATGHSGTASHASGKVRGQAQAKSSRGGGASAGWGNLAPLPPVCLIQRRLPEEDLSAAELRQRRPSAKTGTRRRPNAGGGVEQRVWKTSGGK